MPYNQKKNTTTSLKAMLEAKKSNTVKNKYISTEFQDYGYQLAERLGDLKFKSLYIKLAKEYPRSVLECVYSYVIDYPNADNKGRLFMWRLKQLKAEIAAKAQAAHTVN